MSAARVGTALLAIDAGTTGATAIVVTAGGSIAAHGHQQLRQHLPQPGWVEHAPEEIWQATLAATREALHSWVGSPGDLVGIGITNQRDTVLLWDRETLGSPRRAIVRQDRRTFAISQRLRADGHEERVRELTGLRLDPCFLGTKLVWMAENEPNTWALVGQGRYAIGTVDSYLVARMTRGTWHVTDVSNACRTLLFDLEAGGWSSELCALFGVPMDALPEVVPSWGELARTEPRSFLGLDLPIAGIAGDQQSALFGQTCFDEGSSRCTFGTGAVVLTNTGGLMERSDAGPLSTAAWRSPEGENTYALEGSTAATVDTTGAELYRADLEAVMCEVRDVFDSMPTKPTSLKVDGGAAADDLLCQRQADLLGIAVLRPQILDLTALGAAYMAGLGTGLWDSDDLRESWKLDRRFEPS